VVHIRSPSWPGWWSGPISAFDAAIAEAKAVANRLGTSGSRGQLEFVRAQREEALAELASQELWIENNADLIRDYREVTLEIDRRVAARAILYRSNPPEELLATLGPRTNSSDLKAWDAAAAVCARVRFEARHRPKRHGHPHDRTVA
jgi:hypothetical protein